ncbi:unnamed protein product [Bursaphelenchus xylophilus]|uniref:(pine wood nematode) hypothetical protein n=1 Tax=Bursaphelenchus xylophilus TaxID=6326 RepID=A0A1I7RYT6_BURXY|nr:unnamed protein product [Bursaphelenchus xylophilus]CAG9092254.1 unnamed protein product [Bursaphelenchus xylophilus]
MLWQTDIVFSFVSLLWGSYFCFKMGNVSTISKNLKIIMIFYTASCLYITLCHSLRYLVPNEYVAVAEGRYFNAFFCNGIMFLAHLQLTMLQFQYLHVVIERISAFRERGKYDEKTDTSAYRQLFVNFCVSLALLLVKMRVIWYLYQSVPLDLRLIKITHMLSSVWSTFSIFVVTIISVVSAAILFYRLHQNVKQEEGKCYNLKERYEIEQTKYVLRYVRGLLCLIVALLVAAAACFFAALYFMGYNEESEDDTNMMCVKALMHMSLAGYNLFCMVFMIIKFPELRNSILRDLPFRPWNAELAASRVAVVYGSEAYFKQLQSSWT